MIALLLIVWRRRQADKLWSVKLRDLHFKTDPPEVLGRGTYGLVVAAEFRKTTVAVKRVIPPSASRSGKPRVTTAWTHTTQNANTDTKRREEMQTVDRHGAEMEGQEAGHS